MILTFTGHRPDKLGGYQEPNPVVVWVFDEIKKAILDLKPEKVLVGMAQGVDQMAGVISHHLGVPFVAAVPYDGQEKLWPPKSQGRYHHILSLASEVVVVSPGPYALWKLSVRNRWMIDRSDTVVSVWDGSSGGTCNCTRYAQAQGKKILRIDPKRREVT